MQAILFVRKAAQAVHPFVHFNGRRTRFSHPVTYLGITVDWWFKHHVVKRVVMVKKKTCRLYPLIDDDIPRIS